MINCSVTAFPQPEFQWILQSSGGLFPESSWESVYHDKTAYSTLMHTFTAREFKGVCTTVIMCRAQNSYGTSEQYFTLYLNNCSQAHPTPMLLTNVTSTDDGGKGVRFKGTLIPVIAVAAVILVLAVPILLSLAVILLLRYIVLRRKRR